ncbi:hypothetical protein BDZ91DRAFT_748644 [Kalaharituber pfeilii]|nr:hypothetical protein BDZ91DRAFT_748644 [Kalaharituber pfeilii]
MASLTFPLAILTRNLRNCFCFRTTRHKSCSVTSSKLKSSAPDACATVVVVVVFASSVVVFINFSLPT